MSAGYFEKIALIDLSRNELKVKPLKRSLLEASLGGKGLAARLLEEFELEKIDPLTAHNPLIFAFGPASGLPVWGANRYAAYSISPLTGIFSESYSGGKAFAAIIACGYDAIVITGKAIEWSVLYLDDNEFKLLPASDLLGKDSYQTEQILRQRFADRQCGVLTIGPAGENLVKYAYVNNDFGRSLGRTGFGAIFGSKKLKAMVFAGKKLKSAALSEELKKYFREFFEEHRDHPVVELYKKFGTPNTMTYTTNFEAFPARFWQQGTVNFFEQINASALHSRCQVKPAACSNCFISCTRQTTVLSGKYRGLKIDGPEYETLNAFGGICLIPTVEEIIYLNDLCDRLGMDTISAGNCAGLAIEAFKRGKINFALDYGQTERIAEFLQLVAYRQGIGNLFAEGVRFAASELGLNELAIHVKGLELPAYDPRVLEGMGLSYAISDRGACHLRTTFYKAELSGLIPPDRVEGKVELLLDYEDRINIYDSLILCRFFRDLILWPELNKIINLTTGMKLSTLDLRQISAQTAKIIFQINRRRGITAKDEYLPDFFFQYPLGKAQKVLKREKFNQLLKEYYRLRYDLILDDSTLP